jgi:hypothetical protein
MQFTHLQKRTALPYKNPMTEEQRERAREATRRWRANNPDKYKECYTKQNRKTFEKDPEAYRQKRRDYRVANFEKVRERHAAWRKENRVHINEYRRRQHYKYKYGMTIEDKEAMLAEQGGVCACCGSTEPRAKYGWAVDHCHTTGKVRGILCHHCNVTLGKVSDSPDHLKKLIAYLEKHCG